MLKILVLASIVSLIYPDAIRSQEIESLLEQQQFRADMSKLPDTEVPLDQPIDPSTYRLGPGDKLVIFIWGSLQAQYTLAITPEGKLLLPTIGPVEVAGLLLADAKVLLEKFILERYKDVRVTADLIGLRNFRVSVGGAVKFPGNYTASSIARISEVIALAGGFLEMPENPAVSQHFNQYAALNLPAGKASHRNIIIKHIDGSVDTADVLRLEQTGDRTYDLRLNDGDEILVPLRQGKINIYGIFGGVKSPAYFEYSPRDSLKDLIALAQGLSFDADSSAAELVRFETDGRSFRTISVDLKAILNGSIPDIKLMPDDRIIIRTRRDFNIKHQVLLLGEIKNPGFYAIIPDSTYLTEVIRQAGGFTDLASLSEAEVTRFRNIENGDAEFERLREMQVTQMTDLEYEYFKIKARSKPGRVAVDFRELYLGGGRGDLRLKNGDVVVVPEASDAINVTGEVANPGFVGYNPKFDFHDYVRIAGGYSYRADKGKIRIIKGATGEWQKAKGNRQLFPGDTILVPEKKKNNYLVTIRDVISITANVATVYLVIREATRQ